MAALIAEFFQITGIDATPPTNMAELIPYLLQVLVGAWLVSSVFKLIGALVRAIMDFRRL